MEWLLTGLTVALVILTGALIFYSARMARSSEKLLKATEKLEKTEEQVSEIGLTQIGAGLEKTVTIPKTSLDQDLERLKGNMSVLESISRVRCTWDENALKITYQLNKLPDVLPVLQANAREPGLIFKRLVSDPIDVLLVRYRVRAQERAQQLLQEYLDINQK